MTPDLSVYDNVHCIQFQDIINYIINDALPTAVDLVALILHMPIIEVLPNVFIRLGHIILLAFIMAVVGFYFFEVQNVD